MGYIKESMQELKKVTWPTGKEVVSSTRLVVLSTIVVAIVLGVADFLLLKLFLLVI